MKKGTVVRSKAGHDKGSFFAVVSVCGGFAFLTDGKSRPLDKLKKKNIIHLAVTHTVLDERVMESDSEIRRILAGFNGRGRTFKEVM